MTQHLGVRTVRIAGYALIGRGADPGVKIVLRADAVFCGNWGNWKGLGE